jgi:hypothetical protein
MAVKQKHHILLVEKEKHVITERMEKEECEQNFYAQEILLKVLSESFSPMT